MHDYIGKALIKFICEPPNSIFKEDNSLIDYLSNKEMETLNYMYNLSSVLNKKTNFKKEINNKDEVIKGIINLLEETIINIYPYFDDKVILGIEQLIKNNGVLKKAESFPLRALMSLSKLNYIFIFEEKNEYIIHCPKETLEIFTKIYNDKKILSNKIYININNFITSMLGIYNVIELSKIHSMYIEYFGNVDIEEFTIVILYYSHIEGYLSLVQLEENNFYCGIGIKEEVIENIKEINKEYGYRKFTKSEIKSIMNGKYIFNLNATKELIKFINKNIDIPKEELEGFISIDVENYLHLCEENHPSAGENLLEIIESNFDIDFLLKNKFIDHIKQIYKQYPKAKYNGYSAPLK